MSFFCFSLTLLRICDNIKSFGWSCSEPAPSKFRFQRSWHVSTQKSNTNLDYFTFNQSIKLKFSLYRAIWVCFTWIAHCTPHPLSYTPVKESEELPSIGSLCLRKDFWDRYGANTATRWKVRRESVPTSKEKILERDYSSSCRFFISNGFGWCWYKESVSFCFNNHEIC